MLRHILVPLGILGLSVALTGCNTGGGKPKGSFCLKQCPWVLDLRPESAHRLGADEDSNT